ncbi:MAG: glycoside hydrolase family 30 protein [Anaerolineales bacterium]
MPAAVTVIRTVKNSKDRLSEKEPLVFQEQEFDTPSVLLDSQHRFQVIEGFGGAFTESAADTFYKLPPDARAEILKAYFHPSAGNRYTLCRTHINSCDFSLGNYAYSEVPGDVELKHFSIERDRRVLIPMIKEAVRTSGQPLKILASPWSPPAWMKTNGQMNRGGKLKPEYREAWSRYFVRYLEEYAREGLSIWGITVQNEPQAVQAWESCIYSAEEERDFVRGYLGPALENAGLLGHLKLLIWDHNRDLLFERAKAIYDDAEASRFVWGAAFHWYMGDHFHNVQVTHDAYPEKQLLFSEGCVEGRQPPDEWEIGERYGRSILEDLNHWAAGWIDWNLLLDQSGGPNHKSNFCIAPLMADTDKGTLQYHSSYYYIGHLSRFVRPGARRIVSASTLDELETTAFLNADGQIAAVVMNRSENSHRFSLKYNGLAALADSPPRSISTYLLHEA